MFTDIVKTTKFVQNIQESIQDRQETIQDEQEAELNRLEDFCENIQRLHPCRLIIEKNRLKLEKTRRIVLRNREVINESFQ